MSVLKQSDSKFKSVLTLGSTSFDNNKNTFILDATMKYINSHGREPLLKNS